VATTGLNDCKNWVNILCQNQEILVGGRLGHFWQNWEKKQRQLGFTKELNGKIAYKSDLKVNKLLFCVLVSFNPLKNSSLLSETKTPGDQK
jgi:hypothetical protein